MCCYSLWKMHDPRLSLRDNKLTNKDGASSFGNSGQVQQDLIGCHATIEALAESVFGTNDMILRRCPGISMEAASPGVGLTSCSLDDDALQWGLVVALHHKGRCKLD